MPKVKAFLTQEKQGSFSKKERHSRTRAEEMETDSRGSRTCTSESITKQILQILPSKFLKIWKIGRRPRRFTKSLRMQGGDHQICEEENLLVFDNENLKAHLYGKRKMWAV